MTQNLNNESMLSGSESFSKKVYGVDGKLQWPVRIISPLIFVCVLLVNYLLGVNRNKQVSDNFHLYVTPPGYFFSIWAVIYTGLVVSNVYNLIKNQWTLRTHLFFGISNLLNIEWTLLFDVGTLVAVVFASISLIAIAVFVLLTWIQMGKVPVGQRKLWTYINRNIFAFYLGWLIAASNLNLGMDFVYWWGIGKETQMIIFWVMAPLCAVGAFFFNYKREGIYGMLGCFTVWLSVAWAFAGAAITSNGCLNATLQLC